MRALLWLRGAPREAPSMPVSQDHEPDATDGASPYLLARRTWSHHVGTLVAQRQIWQIFAILALLIALASIGGLVHFAKRSTNLVYVVEVDKHGQTVTVNAVQSSAKADARIIHASVADFIGCARLVTLDVALQRKCVFRVYSMLSPNDPATAKMNEHLNGTDDASPFHRAATELVNTEIKTVIPQTPTTWQVEWVESTRDRQGTLKSQPVTWRALVTTYTAEAGPQTADDQLRNNPLGVYVKDYSWARVQ
jgi:type IV secretion system protein TrbF